MRDPRPEPVGAARAFVGARFPEALAAFLGGSVLGPERTPMSDLDIVVVVGSGASTWTPYRETLSHEGWVVEAFVHTRPSLDRFWELDAARRSCALLRMCCGAVLLDPGAVAIEIQQVARRRLAAGPPELLPDEVDALRYGLSDLLEDLAGCDRDDELAHIAGAVLRQTAELALVAADAWGGTGKALARALTATEPALAERLVHAHRLAVLDGDTAALHLVATDVLNRVGGRLLVGYRADATRETPEPPAAAGDAAADGPDAAPRTGNLRG